MAPPPNRRPGFSRRAQYGLFAAYVVAAAGALLGVVLVVVAKVSPVTFAAFRVAAAEVTAPVSTLLAKGVAAIVSVPAGIGNHFGVMDENARLRRQVTATNRYLQQARGLARENARLRRLAALRDLPVTPVATARLVSSSASSARRFAILNAGRIQGVRPGMPVRGPDGLIGRITEAGPGAARVLLITDPDSAVPVRRTRDGLAAIASGRGDGMVEVRPVMLATADFKVGDVFVTSGVGGIFAPGIPVARAIDPNRDGATSMVFEAPDALDFAAVYQPFLRMPQPPAP